MRFQRLAYLLLAIYFVYFGAGVYFSLSFPVRVVHHVFVSVLFFAWLIQRLRKGRGIPPTPLNWLICAFFAIWFISAIFGMDTRMSLEHIWVLLTHVMIFYVIVNLIQRGYQRILFEILAFLSAILILLAGIEIYAALFGSTITGSVGWIEAQAGSLISSIPNLSLAFGVSTLQAGFTAPLIMLMFGWGLSTSRRDYRVVLWGIAAILFVALLLTRSRGGLLSLLVASGVFIVLRAAQNAYLKRYIAPRLIVALGALGAIVVVGTFVYISLAFAVGASDSRRVDMYQSAISMAQDAPLTGVGVGTFGRAYRDYRDPNLVDDRMATAHNVAFNTLAETGIIGAGLLLAVSGLVLRATWRNWSTSDNHGHRLRIEVCLAALTGLAAHSMVDVFTITAIVLIVLVCVAYCITPLPASRLTPQPQGSLGLVWLYLSLIVGYAVVFIPIDTAYYHYIQSVYSNDLETSLEAIDKAQSYDPYLTLYNLQEAYILAQVGQDERALAAYERAVELEPTWRIGWINLGALQEQQGDTEAALQSYLRAYNINPREDKEGAFNWARLAEAIGHPDEEMIKRFYVRGLLLDHYTRIPSSEFWDETSLRQEVIQSFADLIADAPNNDVEIAYRTLWNYDQTAATEIVPNTPETAADWWVVGEHALVVQDNPQLALEAFEMAMSLEPTNGDYNIARSRALIVLGQLDEARDAIANGQALGTNYEFPNLVLAQLTDDVDEQLNLKIDALPLRITSQEFAATVYNRPSAFEILPNHRYPGFGGNVVQAWLDVAYAYMEQGRNRDARIAFAFILNQAPYNSEAEEQLNALSNP